MDELELFASKILRAEYTLHRAEEQIRKIQRLITLIKQLDTASGFFPTLTPKSSRLKRCADFCASVGKDLQIWDEILKLNRNTLLFLSTCFTSVQLASADFKASELELYVQSRPHLGDREVLRLVAKRIDAYLAGYCGPRYDLFRCRISPNYRADASK